MRAIIKCEFIFKDSLREEQRASKIVKFLKELPWNSPLLDHHENVAHRLQQLYEEFPTIKNYLEETHLKTIYVSASETWGVISETTIGTSVDIRLVNKIGEYLKQACEEVVSGLARVASLKNNKSDFKLNFRSIQILDKESDIPIYIGEPNLGKPFLLALKQQKLETVIGIASLFIALIALYLSSPTADKLYQIFSTQEWANWAKNSIFQISIVTLATGFISFFKIAIYAFDVRRIRPIFWRLSQPA
jgi:hypothetical protein